MLQRAKTAILLFVLLISSLGAENSKAKEGKTVLLAILARNKAHVLPKYLRCIQRLDYDKKLITVYINTNNNQDKTLEILKEWQEENRPLYHSIILDAHEDKSLSATQPHEWNSIRFKSLGAIRNKSLEVAKKLGCDYYFVVDCDNFIAPCTLKELISKDKPIIAPLLRPIPEKDDPYSNFFCDIDHRGYYKSHPDYEKILKGEMVGAFKVPVVHCTYLIQRQYLDQLNYVDDTRQHEFVVFSRNARKNGIDQYICNEKPFGVLIHFTTDVTLEEEMRRLLVYYSLLDKGE